MHTFPFSDFKYAVDSNSHLVHVQSFSTSSTSCVLCVDVKLAGNIQTSATVTIYKILYVFRHYIHMILHATLCQSLAHQCKGRGGITASSFHCG
jgi:hypothetical protein